jgi:type II secretory pathway component PulJ
MQWRILLPLLAVRLRLRIQQTLNDTAWGLLLAALVVLISPMLAGAILFASLLLGFWRASHDVAAAARLIDHHYHLKDRILTAIALLQRKNSRTPMEQLQVEDTAESILVVQPKAVVPIRFPKIFWLAAAVLVVDLVVIHGDFSPLKENAELVLQFLPEEDILLSEKIAKTTEALIQQHAGEPSLQKLSEQLEMLWKQFDMSGKDIKESLATLSEMEEAFQTALDALQLETMEESMQELAKTLELAERTVPLSKNLEKGNYREAASELKKLDAEMLKTLSEPERKAMIEQMQSLADNAEQRKQKPLHDAAQKMSDALENEDGEQFKFATDELASEVEKHGVRKEIGKNLANQMMALAMMKAESGPGNMSGGKGTDKTEQESQTWGSGSAGNPNEGKETDLQGKRQQEILTGELSEQGDSVKETIDSQEMAAATSLLQYREQYQRYKKISEAVLDTEPIPLGQRQIIRRYFEAIRPNVD